MPLRKCPPRILAGGLTRRPQQKWMGSGITRAFFLVYPAFPGKRMTLMALPIPPGSSIEIE